MSKKEVPPPDEIISHLYLGTRANAKDINLLDKIGITHIMNVAEELDTQPPTQRADLRYMKITVSELDILSGKNQWDKLEAVFQFIGTLLEMFILQMMQRIIKANA